MKMTQKNNILISPRVNYRLVYEHKAPEWQPSYFYDMRFLTPRIDPDNIARCFCFESNPLTYEEIEDIAINGYKDKFGVPWVYVPQSNGSIVRPGSPLLSDLNDWKNKISFPDIESWDWEGSKKSNAEYVNTDKFLCAIILTGFFERLVSWMDFEAAAMALIDEDQKDAVHEVFDELAGLYIKIIDKYILSYGIDLLSFHDDWGGQHAPIFSLATVREMIVPHIKKIADYCRSRSVFFDMHSCGKIESLIPALIEAGCDSWSGQNINDKKKLNEQYGSKIIIADSDSY